MSRHAKPARLWLHEREGREAEWIILDRGRQHRTGCAAGDSGGAERVLQAYLAAQHRIDWSDHDPDRVSVAAVLTHYAAGDHARGLRRKDTVRAAVKQLGRFFIGRKVGQITPELCKAYRAHRAAMPRAQYTKDPANAPRVGDPMIRRELEVLQAAIGVAYEDRKLKYRVPVWRPDPPPARERFLERDEIAALVWAAWRQDQSRSKHLARFILVSFYTGSRAAALLSLQWMANTTGGWVNLEQGVIYRKARAETETDKRRPPVGISRRLAAHLSRWRPKNRKGHVIEADGAPVKSVRRAFHTARVAAGLGDDVIIHTLRHTFASHAIMNGVSFGEVAEAIGSTEQIVKRVYGHLAQGYTRATVEAVARGRR